MTTRRESTTRSTRQPIVRAPVSDGERASEAVLRAFEGVDRREATGVLYDYLDPDALDALVGAGRGEVTVRTELWGHPVVVTPDLVTVYEPN